MTTFVGVVCAMLLLGVTLAQLSASADKAIPKRLIVLFIVPFKKLDKFRDIQSGYFLRLVDNQHHHDYIHQIESQSLE
jgi:hypothetical protein